MNEEDLWNLGNTKWKQSLKTSVRKSDSPKLQQGLKGVRSANKADKLLDKAFKPNCQIEPNDIEKHLFTACRQTRNKLRFHSWTQLRSTHCNWGRDILLWGIIHKISNKHNCTLNCDRLPIVYHHPWVHGIKKKKQLGSIIFFFSP